MKDSDILDDMYPNFWLGETLWKGSPVLDLSSIILIGVIASLVVFVLSSFAAGFFSLDFLDDINPFGFSLKKWKMLLFIGFFSTVGLVYSIRTRERYWLHPEHLVVRKGPLGRRKVFEIKQLRNIQLVRIEYSNSGFVEIGLARPIENPFVFSFNKMDFFMLGPLVEAEDAANIILKQWEVVRMG